MKKFVAVMLFLGFIVAGASSASAGPIGSGGVPGKLLLNCKGKFVERTGEVIHVSLMAAPVPMQGIQLAVGLSSNPYQPAVTDTVELRLTAYGKKYIGKEVEVWVPNHSDAAKTYQASLKAKEVNEGKTLRMTCSKQ